MPKGWRWVSRPNTVSRRRHLPSRPLTRRRRRLGANSCQPMVGSSVSPVMRSAASRPCKSSKARASISRTPARAQKSYFHRWVRNPLRIDPATKMPVYFDAEGKSPLADYYNGDAEKQIEAIWQYIRLGDKMPSPAEPQ